jgi:predicted aminopeptidase
MFGTIWLMIFLMTLTGCESVRYYSHVAYGQLHIVRLRQPIKEIISNPQTDSVLKQKLEQVLAIRKFAQTDLSLPVDDNYLSYVDLKRPFVVWNVGAAPEFSLTPKTWYYPIVGHASYRGYFSEDRADAFAEQLKNDGLDVYVGGVTAYSTLGWFSDPVFNTIIRGRDDTTAALIFHELAHQILYVSDDTTFNESFATAVEQEGLRRWMVENGNMTGYKDYLERRQRREKFISLITKYREKLEELYRQRLKPSDMRQRKAAVFLSLKNEYATLKSSWGGYAGYDAWFEDQLNNAKLNSIGAYYDMVPAFNRLLASENGNLEAFYEKCRILSDLPPPERGKRLNEWQSNSTPEIQAKNGKPQR